MNDLVRGWKMAIKLALKEADRYATFNEANFNISKSKGCALPKTLKDLDIELWKAFRAGQAQSGESIGDYIRLSDWTRLYDETQPSETMN